MEAEHSQAVVILLAKSPTAQAFTWRLADKERLGTAAPQIDGWMDGRMEG